MNKSSHFIRWVISNFFYLTIVVFIFLYLCWFRLNPIVFSPGGQAAAPLIFGFILLSLYGCILGMLKLSRNHRFIKGFFSLIAILGLAINVVFLFFYFPRLHASARFGKSTYYITSNLPFLECCGYFQFTEWDGLFHYITKFNGYRMPQVKFIHDQKTDEVSLVDVSDGFEKLYETVGKTHRSYDGYAKLENHLYYSSAKCNRNQEGVCETWTYVLYQCELDNTSCLVLPIEYTTGLDGWVNLEANESRKEIRFYFEEYFSAEDGTLIYTYSQSSQCFVEGCSIIK